MNLVFYPNMLPFFIVSTVLGALYVANIFRKKEGSMVLGAGLGATAGFVGSWLFMLPLQSCTFEPERTTTEFNLGLFLFFVGATVFAYGVGWTSRYLLSSSQERRIMIGSEATKGAFQVNPLVPIILLMPTIAILVVFIYYPAIQTFLLSTRLVRLGAPRTRFVCVRNFTELVEPTFSPMTLGILAAGFLLFGATLWLRRQPDTDRDLSNNMGTISSLVLVVAVYLVAMDFWSEDYRLIFFNTIFISGMIVVLGLVLSLGIAYLAFQPVRGAAVYRTLLIWPYAISPTIAGILFATMFNPTSGIVDHLLETIFGISMPPILQNAWLARWTIIMASVWNILGYNILFYLAGLQNVSKDLVQAAAIDGANGWQRFRYVVLPSLSPITFFLIITNLTTAFFSIFGTIDFLTKGAPAGATSVQIYEIFRVGIENKDLGRGAAQSIILFLGVILVTVWQFRTSGKQVNYGS
ncbi:MAG: sugar ABC transporter permease [Chloroflexota bacterium]